MDIGTVQAKVLATVRCGLVWDILSEHQIFQRFGCSFCDSSWQPGSTLLKDKNFLHYKENIFQDPLMARERPDRAGTNIL